MYIYFLFSLFWFGSLSTAKRQIKFLNLDKAAAMKNAKLVTISFGVCGIFRCSLTKRICRSSIHMFSGKTADTHRPISDPMIAQGSPWNSTEITCNEWWRKRNQLFLEANSTWITWSYELETWKLNNSCSKQFTSHTKYASMWKTVSIWLQRNNMLHQISV